MAAVLGMDRKGIWLLCEKEEEVFKWNRKKSSFDPLFRPNNKKKLYESVLRLQYFVLTLFTFDRHPMSKSLLFLGFT